jgi:hypothetical protein
MHYEYGRANLIREKKEKRDLKGWGYTQKEIVLG